MEYMPDHKFEWYINFDKEIRTYFEGDIKIFFYDNKIFPEKVIHNRGAYQIVEAAPYMHVHSYYVTTCNKKIRSVTVFGFHPNADPCTNALCLPADMPHSLYNQETHNRIETTLRVYNIDSCHFNPLQYIKLKKLDSMAVTRKEKKK
jgi:hypothetical protein